MAKYSPRVAPVSCTQDTKPIRPWPFSMTLKFNKVLEVVEARVNAKFQQAAKCSGSRVNVVTNFLSYLAMVKIR